MKKFSIQPSLNLSKNLFGDPKNRGIEFIKLGRLSESGPIKDIFFDVSGERVVGIFGKRGSGKSFTLASFIEGFFTKDGESDIGKINQDRAGIIFDPLNIFWSLKNTIKLDDQNPYLKEQTILLKKWKIKPTDLNVSIFIPTGTRLKTTPKEYKEFSLDVSSLVAEDWASLFDLDLYLDRIGQLLNDLWYKLVVEGWEGNGENIGPNPDYSIQDLLNCLQNDSEIQRYYNRETIRALYQRINSFKNNPLFSSTGTKLQDLLIKGHLSVLELNLLDDNLRSVLTAVLMRKILRERSKASELEKQLKLNSNLTEEERKRISEVLRNSVPHTWVFIDEAQILLPSEKKIKSSEIIVKFVKEGRNYGLSLGFTSQQPSAIDNRVMSQLDTLMIHKLTVKGDIEFIDKNLKTNNPISIKYGNRDLDFIELIRSLDCGQAIISNTETERNFVIEVRPRITAHGGIEG